MQTLTNLPVELSAAPPGAIVPVLDAWEAHEGGSEGWYHAHGGTSAILASLRERLLA